MSTQGHPQQPILFDQHGVARFQQNAIVRWLLDESTFNLNDIAINDFTDEDRRQFAQLIGYSVSSYQDLDYGAEDPNCSTFSEQIQSLKIPARKVK